MKKISHEIQTIIEPSIQQFTTPLKRQRDKRVNNAHCTHKDTHTHTQSDTGRSGYRGCT